MRMDEKGVSPVIGVILMVAITVILAAVIASFVFGISGTVKRTYTLSFQTAQITANEVKLLYTGGDGAYVVGLRATVNGQDASVTATANDGLSVGEQVSVTLTGLTAGQSFDLVLIAQFSDGSEQIVYSARLIVPQTTGGGGAGGGGAGGGGQD